jgi:erythromycin esterase
MYPLITVVPGTPGADVDRLGQMIGNASVVALGEGVHGAAEPLEFRNRLFQYLVKSKGFTAIAIESGLVESRVVHDYVLGGLPGDARSAASEGISWTFDRLPQNLALIEWLRAYNADPSHHQKVNFYGFDIPGSPGKPSATRGMDTALVQVLRYLRVVDPPQSRAFDRRIEPFLKSIRLDLSPAPGDPAYYKLTEVERDKLTAAISDLVVLLERCQQKYIDVSSIGDYEWGYRAAIGARQADTWLRQMPIGWRPSTKNFGFFFVASDVRDRAQADNLAWAIKEEGPLGKVLIFAHSMHLSMASIEANSHLLRNSSPIRQEPAGTYLRGRLGYRLLTIGNVVGTGRVDCNIKNCCDGLVQDLEVPANGSIGDLARRVGEPKFYLDLRASPPIAAGWLNRRNSMGRGSESYSLEIARAFDVLLFIDTVKPACENE